MNNQKIDRIIKKLKSGEIGVLPTDTLYGLVGLATNKKTILRLRQIKKRQTGKPFIILISSIADLAQFRIKLDKKTDLFLKKIWPGPISVVFSSKLSFRLPQNKFLLKILKKTGPLAAPSANPQGQKPAETITEAKRYFGNEVDFYWGAKQRLTGPPSTLIKIKNGKIEILRSGRQKIKQLKI